MKGSIYDLSFTAKVFPVQRGNNPLTKKEKELCKHQLETAMRSIGIRLTPTEGKGERG